MSAKVIEADAGIHSLAMSIAVRKLEHTADRKLIFYLAGDELAPLWYALSSRQFPVDY